MKGSFSLPNNNSPFSLRKHLIQGTIGSLILKITQTGLSLILSVVLGRQLGVKDFGIYSFCISVATLLTVPAMLGGQNLLIREIPSYETKGEFQCLHGLLRFIRRTTASFSLFLAISVAGIGFMIYQGNPMQVPFLAAMGLVPMITAINLQGAALRGFRHVVLSQANLTLVPALVIILLSITFWYRKFPLNPETAIIINVISVGFIVAITHLCILRHQLGNVQNIIPRYEISQWVKSMLPFFLTGGMQILNTEASVILLGVIQGPEAVGIFHVAQRGAMLVPFGLIAVNMAIGPTVADLHEKGEKDRLQNIIGKSIVAVAAFSLPVALFLILGGSLVIPFVFGKEYAAAYIPLVILCSGQLVNACMGSVGVILNMIGLERLVARGVTIATATNVALNVALIEPFGPTGAAIASSVSLLIWNLLLVLWLYRKTGLVSTLRFKYLIELKDIKKSHS